MKKQSRPVKGGKLPEGRRPKKQAGWDVGMEGSQGWWQSPESSQAQKLGEMGGRGDMSETGHLTSGLKEELSQLAERRQTPTPKRHGKAGYF